MRFLEQSRQIVGEVGIELWDRLIKCMSIVMELVVVVYGGRLGGSPDRKWLGVLAAS
jgi:hypothetical protein